MQNVYVRMKHIFLVHDAKIIVFHYLHKIQIKNIYNIPSMLAMFGSCSSAMVSNIAVIALLDT